MNKIILCCSLGAVLTLGCFAAYQMRQNLNGGKQIAATCRELADQKKAFVQLNQDFNGMSAKLEEITGVLKKSTAELDKARNQVATYEHAQEAAKIATEPVKPSLPPIPGEARMVVNGEQKSFPHLLSISGMELMADAEFRGINGSKVIFRLGATNAVAYDVDQLHPSVLSQLNIDPQAAKIAQTAMDEHGRAYMASMKKRAGEIVQQRGAFFDDQARLEAEQAKKSEEIRQQQLRERIMVEAAENDRMRALAARRAADAAIISASRIY